MTDTAQTSLLQDESQETPHDTAVDAGALCMEELIVDVRGRSYTDGGITAEACCHRQAGVNISRHGARGEPPEQVIDALLESVERLGIRARTYRIVREDLPAITPVEFRKAS